MKCCICLDDKKVEDQNCVSCFKCYTCKDGFVCNNCIPDFDPRGSIFIGDLDDVKDTIKCPCCREFNWKYHYNQIIQITLGYDLWDYIQDYNASIKLFIKNYAEAKGYELDEYLVEDNARKEREKWVDDYNNSLPQKKCYSEEFKEEFNLPIGGIYDSEYMNYVWDNIPSNRIKELRNIIN